MKARETILSGALYLLLGAAGGAAAWWLLGGVPTGGGKPASAPLPATVPKVLKEEQITTVTLTPKAVARLALRTDTVRRRRMPRARAYGGEVVIPPGQVVIVSAPLGGALKAPPGGLPEPGRVVKKGQAVIELSPLLTPEGKVSLATAKIEADGQVMTTRATLEGARVALERAEKLVRGQAGSQRGLDEAQAAHDVARKAAEAAEARRATLRKIAGELDNGTTAPLVLGAPEAGVLRNLSALPGQTVPSGAALFEVVSLDWVWVRVPVYVADLPAIDAVALAGVTALSARPGEAGLEARPIVAPPSANPATGTADLYYKLDNRRAAYRPGQRVGVNLPLKGEQESLTLPWSAVLIDVHGGTWVYEETGERTYTRRRVTVSFVSGETAVLSGGTPTMPAPPLAPGTRVVTAGAAELFGAEAGFSK